MTTRDEWSDWRESWSAGQETAGQLATVLDRARRARRARLALSVARVGLVSVALVSIALALWHAGSPLEMMLGLTAGVAIAFYAIVEFMYWRRAWRFVAALPDEYVAALREARRRQLRFIQFAWSVMLLELVFLVPWWVGGIPVHARELGSHIVIIGFWIPAVGILAFAAWSARLWRRAKADLRRLGA